VSILANAPISVLILDDHSLFREVVARLLNAEENLSVCGQCATVEEAVAILSSERVDVILLDYDLGTELGTDFLKTLCLFKETPRILMVTAGMTDRAKREAFSVGAAGIVLKHSRPEILIDAIRKAAAEEPPSHAEFLAKAHADRRNEPVVLLGERQLTRRQSDVLRGIFDGLGNRAIGETINASETAVKAVIQELFHKAGVRSRSQLVRIAFEKHAKDWIGSR
jgi:two-component system, NarL family, nitrate/nitrite response regulator NarL